MRKLFQLSHSITIDEFTSLSINGPYQLVNLEPTIATIRCSGYVIHLQAEHLIVERLEEEVAVITCEAILSCVVKQDSRHGVAYEK